MTQQFTFAVNLSEQKEGGYLVEFPDLPEAITQGETVEDALKEAADCLEEAIANRMELNLDIPSPRKIGAQQYSVTAQI